MNRLVLHVLPSGKTVWRWNYYFGGKQNTLTLGGYPAISIAQARKLRIEADELRQNGIDPNQHKRDQKFEILQNQQNNFKAIAEDWLTVDETRTKPKTNATKRQRLARHVYRTFGNRPIKSNKPLEVRNLLRRQCRRLHPENPRNDRTPLRSHASPLRPRGRPLQPQCRWSFVLMKIIRNLDHTFFGFDFLDGNWPHFANIIHMCATTRNTFFTPDNSNAAGFIFRHSW